MLFLVTQNCEQKKKEKIKKYFKDDLRKQKKDTKAAKKLEMIKYFCKSLGKLIRGVWFKLFCGQTINYLNGVKGFIKDLYASTGTVEQLH